jgi:ribosome-associated translation inhibitor RaiA
MEQNMQKVKVRGDLNNIDDDQKEIVNKKIERFIQKHGGTLSELYLKMDCSELAKTSRIKSPYICKVQAQTEEGMFNAINKDIGPTKSLFGAFQKIERQIRSK